MKNTIEIETDESGVALFNITAITFDNLRIHLERINTWINQLHELKRLVSKTTITIPFSEYNFALEYNAFITICMLDLAAITRQLYISKHKWEQLFFAKQGYALIFETIQTFNNRNKEMHNLFIAKNAKQLLEYSEVSNEIKAFKARYNYDTTIKNVRNKVAAHMDSFTTYYSIINSMDHKIALVAMKDLLLT